MAQTRVPHLELRGRVFYFRRAIPNDLKPQFGRLAEAEQVRSQIPQAEEDLANQVFHPSVHVEADEQLDKHGLEPIPPSSETYLQLCTGIARAAIEQRRILVGLLEGDPGALQPRDPLFAGLVTTDLPPIPGQREIASAAALRDTIDK